MEQQINANTGMLVTVEGQTTVSDAEGDAVPYGHLSRLADKLIGGVETSIDLALDAAINKRSITVPVSGQSSLLPQNIASFVQRNITGIIIASVAGLFALLVLSYRR